MEKATKHRDGSKDNPMLRRALIAARARNKPKEQFNNLLHHLTYELIEECLNKIPKSSAVGIDGVTVEQAKNNLSWILPPLLKQIHQGKYQAPAVRRVYIPKANGKQRPIGVPEVVDRAIQAAMAQILNEIYEQDFQKCSFGFRHNLGCHHALATVSKLLTRWKMNYVLEVDIRDFFGCLSHKWLRQFLGIRIKDIRIIKLIDAWLKAGVVEGNKWQESEGGVPQGGSISPLLANIYLHYVLDLWFEKKMKLQYHKQAHLIRFCDDFVVLFKRKEELEIFKSLLKTRLHQFELEVAEEKTHVTELVARERRGTQERRHMSFLGFKIFRTVSTDMGKHVIVFRTEGSRFTRAKAQMKDQLWHMVHFDMKTQAKRINSILRGHNNYYGLPGNSKKISGFWRETIAYWRQCLSRRSQNGRKNLEEMKKVVEEYKIIKPCLKVTYKTLEKYARL